ncbi:MAG TPA: chemotaxis-specific protein-glutamate methyltransferase CheB [Coriobacteriia bacterium]
MDHIRVVVVDDSLVAREMLCQILSSDPDIEVVGTARDGQAGVDLVTALKPDLVTMDIHMPRMDGLEATENIMAFHPTPILVVSSSVHGEGIGRAFDALSAGALEVVKKPEPSDWAELEHIGRDIIRRVKLLANVKVITHLRGRRPKDRGQQAGTTPLPDDGFRLVAIGSSTGGPSALATVLGALPADLPVPVAIAQHIAEGFVPGLVNWLDGMAAVKVKMAEHGESPQPGVVYMSPTGGNLEIVPDGKLRFVPPSQGQLYVPSADNLFASTARVFGPGAVGVILTGMGADGALGLKALKDAGAVTIGQDEKTSVVYGMPKAALDMGAVREVLPIDKIGGRIAALCAARRR